MQAKTLIRNLLFVVVAAALGLFCTGCVTAHVLNGQFGAKESRFDLPKYAMSPDRREIILTSAWETRRFDQPPQIWNSTWKECIPVELVPDCLMRCFLFVEPDPDAPRYWHDAPFVINTDVLPLNEDKTLYLRVHPDELDDLSQPFKVKLIPQGEEAGPPEKQPEGELRMMFPVAVNGNMYVLLTAAPGEPRTNLFRQKAKELVMQEVKGQSEFSYFIMIKRGLNFYREYSPVLTKAADEWDEREADRYLYPFCDRMDEVRMIEYERRIGERFPTWDAVLWKALWLPPAVVVDTVLMPTYFVWSVGLYAFLSPLSGGQ